MCGFGAGSGANAERCESICEKESSAVCDEGREEGKFLIFDFLHGCSTSDCFWA